jgi:sec-independent protein translocase protein TatA
MTTAAWYNLLGQEFCGEPSRRLCANPRWKEFMGNLGIPELLIILCIIILVFGANRLPEIGRGIGRGIKNFKEATKGGTEEAEKS